MTGSKLLLAAVIFGACVASGARAMSTLDICQRTPVHTTALKTDGDNGFRIRFIGTPEIDKYAPGHEYTVTINGTFPNQQLLGFMLVAVPQGQEAEHKSLGEFSLLNDGVVKVAEQCRHTVLVHRFLVPKSAASMKWTSPSPGSGCVEFRATVIEKPDIWYKDDGALTKVLCEEQKSQQDAMVNDNQETECCACGQATYKMVFTGKWSRHNHPKDFPKQKHLLHWSNIIGASHASSYKIWKYGGYASPGVKYVCEFGSSTILEREMKNHGKEIRTVIKTHSMWHNVLRTLQAMFTVTKDKSYLSILTMIGPSPDWCIGISSLNLCQANCTWADSIEMDLYPWDAGTDSGLSYMSPNSETDPQENIHRITHQHPNHPQSPFYGTHKMKPMATVVLTKEKEKCTDTDVYTETEEHSPSTQELVDMMKKKMMMKKKLEMEKCATSTWSEWTGCSASCGMGMRERRRMLKNSIVSQLVCNKPLLETEKCFGLANSCLNNMMKKKKHQQQIDPKLRRKMKKLRPGKIISENFQFMHQKKQDMTDKCAVTPWSDWSPCSVTCSRGMKERWRMLLHKSANSEQCGLRLREMDLCIGGVFVDCKKAEMMKNYTVICSYPPEDGPCRAEHKRWYYDVKMKKCLPFIYGGCRGNDNQFELEEECRMSCVNHMSKLQVASQDEQYSLMEKKKQMQMQRRIMRRMKKRARKNRRAGPHVHCMVTPWTDWSPCSVTCGKGIISKTRMIKVQAENGGRKCPKRLMRKKRCKMSKCPIDCKMGEWGVWSSCPETCKMEGVQKIIRQKRRRHRIQKPKHGGIPCPPKVEKRHCNLPLCPRKEEIMSTEMIPKEMPPVDQPTENNV